MLAACAPLPAALVGDNESFESIPGGQEGASKLVIERIRNVSNDLVTRPQLIEEARKNLLTGQEMAAEYPQVADTYLKVAQTAALIAIADALNALLQNGLMVERP